ncbi:hypothetical protein [Streptomyces tendae]|uniref:hypothetical protein n=1 Tax=Streptomyces tendae TaxID=1932 RepID=UPI003D718D5D
MSTENLPDRILELQAELARAREAAFREAAGRLRKLRMAEREWLPATGLHKGEQELSRMAEEARQSAATRTTHRPQEGSAV